MKTLVVYRSVTGYTRQIAQWIASDLHADVAAADTVGPARLRDYDCVVFGGRLHAVGIDGLSLIKRNWAQLKDKRVLVFATGASPARSEVLEEVKKKNLTKEQQARIQLFYFRGGFDYARLPLGDKLLMNLLKYKLLRKQRRGTKLDPDETGMLNLYERATDFTRKEAIRPLVQAASRQEGKA